MTLLASIMLTACGSKGDRYATSASSASAKQDSNNSTLILRPTNQLTAAREWISEEGDKYKLIGEFTNSEMKSVSLSAAKDVREAGTLSYVRTHTEFQPAYPSSTPMPNQNFENVDTQLTVFIVRASEDSSQVTLAVKSERGAAELDNSSTSVAVETDYQYRCIAIKVPQYDSALSTSLPLCIAPYTTTCDENEMCQMKTGLGDLTASMSFAEAAQKYGATCAKDKFEATRTLHLNNTSRVSSYQIRLFSEFKQVAREIDFDNLVP